NASTNAGYCPRSLHDALPILLWLAVVALLAACATTHLKDSWKDPQFSGAPFRNVLVIGISRSDANRRLFEDGFVQALRAAGIERSEEHTSELQSREKLVCRLL